MNFLELENITEMIISMMGLKKNEEDRGKNQGTLRYNDITNYSI